MKSDKKRAPVTIRFRFNKESGEIEDLIIDDNAASKSEDFHDQVALLIASQLVVKPEIADAGPIRHETETWKPTGVTEASDPSSVTEATKKKRKNAS